jgi:hypothetical protein
VSQSCNVNETQILNAFLHFLQMYLSQEEIALAMQMTGNTPEEMLTVQEYLQEARTTQNFLEQVSSCRELINILDWRFPQYEKSSSVSYKLLCM